jgi:hypothetical protein
VKYCLPFTVYHLRIKRFQRVGLIKRLNARGSMKDEKLEMRNDKWWFFQLTDTTSMIKYLMSGAPNVPLGAPRPHQPSALGLVGAFFYYSALE